jgi:hypothetical protein
MKQEEGSKYVKNTVARYFISIERLKLFLQEEYSVTDISWDIFLFMCYTGLSYADLAKLTPNDNSTGIDGGKWIISERNKTGIRFSIPLLPK